MPPGTDPARRAVVTGLGAVTPIGNDATTFWESLLAGRSGAGPITSFDPSGFDVRIAAEVKDFDPTTAMDRKMARRMSLRASWNAMTLLAHAATCVMTGPVIA